MAAREESEVVAAGGVTLRAARWHQEFDLLVVPAFDLRSPRHVDRALDRLRPEIAYIAAAADAGVPVASVCVGAFLLGEAGLLDGWIATASWLGIVQAHAGDDLARRVARLTLVADNRNSQAPYVDEELLGSGGDALAQSVKGWLVERLAEPYDLAVLARAFHVSTRTLLRRFGDETGQSPLSVLQQARVNAAKRLLEMPGETVASAMRHVGYADPASFRRLFTTQAGMTPAAYRRQFRASQPVRASGANAPNQAGMYRSNQVTSRVR